MPDDDEVFLGELERLYRERYAVSSASRSRPRELPRRRLDRGLGVARGRQRRPADQAARRSDPGPTVSRTCRERTSTGLCVAGGGGDQFSTVEGLASDDVARVELFLRTGERIAVPLRDNVFAARAARSRAKWVLVVALGEHDEALDARRLRLP